MEAETNIIAEVVDVMLVLFMYLLMANCLISGVELLLVHYGMMQPLSDIHPVWWMTASFFSIWLIQTVLRTKP